MSKTAANNEIQEKLSRVLRYNGVEEKNIPWLVNLFRNVILEKIPSIPCINGDSNRLPLVTIESMVTGKVRAILFPHLEEAKIEVCIRQLLEEGVLPRTEGTTEIETIFVEGSKSPIYANLLRHKPVNEAEKNFLENLRVAIKARVKPFRVPVCDPSIDEDGHIRFIAGCKPAVGYSYNELKKLASMNDLQLGDKNRYILFVATILHRLNKAGCDEVNSFEAVCTDSISLGHYRNSGDAKDYFELTGSRGGVTGKDDQANTRKVLLGKKEFYCAGGCYTDLSYSNPLACCRPYTSCDSKLNDAVGWFIF